MSFIQCSLWPKKDNTENHKVEYPCRVYAFQTTHLEHVCVAVMSVLHHHCLCARQCVWNTVLLLVADGLNKTNMKEEALLVCLRHERISSTAIAGILILMEACQEEYFETGNKSKMF